jgi:hypothetical protein
VRRPLPPELITLGDQLEAAAARALARRRTRRQQVLNALASLVVVVPVAASLITTQMSTTDGGIPTPTPTPTAQPIARVVNNSGLRPARDDFPPRDLRRMREAPNSALLLSSPALRPALR